MIQMIECLAKERTHVPVVDGIEDLAPFAACSHKTNGAQLGKVV